MRVYNFEEFMNQVGVYYFDITEDEVINALEWHGFDVQFLDCIDEQLVDKVVKFIEETRK